MKAQDVVVLCKLFIYQSIMKQNWTYALLSVDVCLSFGEAHASVRRLKNARLFDEYTKSVLTSSMKEFLIHGFKYCFPPELGSKDVGLVTSYAAPVFENSISYSDQDIYIWPYVKGTVRGIVLKPLYDRVPEAASKDVNLYRMLALLDAIRIGKVRERAIAMEKLHSMIGE